MIPRKLPALDDREATFRSVAIIGMICFVCMMGAYLVGLSGPMPLPVDRFGIPLGRDFMNTWFYGRSFFESDPGRFYDRAVYGEAIQQVFPNNLADHIWSYPPPFLILAAPFGLLPYVPAFCAWTLLGLLVLGWVVRRHGSWWLVVAVLTAPITAYALIAGQISLLAAAVVLAAFDRLDRQPVHSGLLLSLLVIKPQMAALFPVFLIASRRWTALAACALGALAIILLSIGLNHWDTWWRFLHLGLPAQAKEMRDTILVLAPISVSPTTTMVLAGLPPWLVSGIQGGALLLAAALVAWAGRKPKAELSLDRACLVVLSCAIFATPYLLIHDLVAFSAAALIVAYRGGLFESRIALIAVVYTPVAQTCLTTRHIYLAPVLALGCSLWIVAKLLLERGDAAPAPFVEPEGLAAATRS